MRVTATPAMIGEVEALRRKVRADRHASSIPLLTFGALTALSLALTAPDNIWPFMGYLWLVAGPAGFLLIGWYYRQREASTGVGPGHGSYLSLGGWGLVGMVFLFPVLAIFGLPFAAVGLGLAVMAWRQRNLYLGAFGVVFGVLGTLEVGFFTVSNLFARAYDRLGLFGPHGYTEWGQSIVVGLIATAMVAGGFGALHRERRVS